MLLQEILTLPPCRNISVSRHPFQLNEAVDLDFAKMHITYGSWVHPNSGEVVYCSSMQSHKTVAQDLLGFTPEQWRQIPIRDADEYTQMFKQGWVRLVHGGLIQVVADGFKEQLASLFRQILPIRNFAKSITVDIELYVPNRGSAILKAELFHMPSQWNKLLAFVR